MLNKLKELTKKLINDIKQADYKDPGTLVALGLFLLFPVAVSFMAVKLSKIETNDIRAASVKIVTRSQKSGGTGIILQSQPNVSSILTNDHVCRAVKSGGIVKTNHGDFQVNAILESEVSDLCLISVLADLKVNTNLARVAPQFYDKAIVSGHPALMPNVITTGHFSGRTIIEVMSGIRKCTEEELMGPLGGVCAFFGGIPVLHSYDSTLVTATIMPGSSGSGVYNEKEELAGVVFAGSQGFGYAWTVPYEQVLNFLYVEHPRLKTQLVKQELELFSEQEENKLREALKKCDTSADELVAKYCNILKRDTLAR